MKFLASRAELSALVGCVQNIVALKAPSPLLSNLLVEASNSRVTLTATDLTVGVRVTLPAKVLEPGASAVPAKRFDQLLKSLTTAYIEHSSNEKEVNQIVAGASVFRMNGMAKNDFPTLPEVSDLAEAKKVVVGQKDLKDALLKTVFVISQDESRYILMGLSCTITEQAALFVGTDGKRLARVTIPVRGDQRFTYSCVIPAKAVVELAKHLKDGEETATLLLLPDKFAVATEDRFIITKLLSGEYPDVERVIPHHSNHVIAVNREELGALLRQVSLFIPGEGSVRCSLETDTLRLSANTANLGEGNAPMSIPYSGPFFEIAFNPVFFSDILRHCQGEHVFVGIQDAFNPLLLADTEFGMEMDTFPASLFILMPLRLNG